MKKIADQKLQAFSVGTMGMRPLSRRELEEQKKKEEEEAAAHVFQEFVETFQEAPSKNSKVWIKAGTYDAGARKEDTSERGKLYKPQSRLSDADKPSSMERTQEYVRLLASKPDKPTKRGRDKDKKKSNLELFKEELRQIQEEREERHKYKGALKGMVSDINDPDPFRSEVINGSYDYGDPTTTNLYLGNLNPKVTEQQLMEIFGRYGPLASIKIMWPRSDEEKARGRNCGFVAYMSRRDGERALRNLNGKDVLNYEMKMGWGKAVTIPTHPIYIPPTMQEGANAGGVPPPSGLPFNAQPPRHLYNKIPRLRPGEAFPTDPQDKEAFDKILSQSIVKVVIPKERHILMLIHRTIEFVIREGPMFEAMIMNKQINSKSFKFLFENQSSDHVYYRWKLFSLLQGDQPKQWSTKDFRMFKGGSIWRPPVLNVYTQGMPEELVEEDDVKDTKGTLSKTQRERLEELIRNLTPERLRVGEAMVFCMEHADAAEEISECLAEALANPSTALHKKVARVYLLSDILHNCSSKLNNATHFRKTLEVRLVQIMRDMHETCQSIESRLQAEGLRTRMLCVLQAWEEWALYPKDFLQRLHRALQGHPLKDSDIFGEEASLQDTTQLAEADDNGEEDAGDEEEEEGGPLDGAALLKAAQTLQLRQAQTSTAAAQPALHDDIDGVPMEDLDGTPLDSLPSPSPTPAPAVQAGFIPSRWESVEPVAVHAGAMTSQRWEEMTSHGRASSQTPSAMDEEPSTPDNDTSEVSDERRMLLRSVELRTMQYQDEIEGGQRQLKAGWTMAQQVQHYRRKLIKKAEREAKEKEDAASDSPTERVVIVEKKSHRDKDRDRERERESRNVRSGSSDDEYMSSSSSRKKKSRDVSLSPPPKRSRHRSRSPARSSKSSRTGSERRVSPPSPPPPPVISSSSSSSHRRSESSSRKHKHKHKY